MMRASLYLIRKSPLLPKCATHICGMVCSPWWRTSGTSNYRLERTKIIILWSADHLGQHRPWMFQVFVPVKKVMFTYINCVNCETSQWVVIRSSFLVCLIENIWNQLFIKYKTSLCLDITCFISQLRFLDWKHHVKSQINRLVDSGSRMLKWLLRTKTVTFCLKSVPLLHNLVLIRNWMERSVFYIFSPRFLGSEYFRVV